MIIEEGAIAKVEAIKQYTVVECRVQ